MFSAEQSGEGEARPTGLTRTVKGSEPGVVRPAARSARTRPPAETTPQAALVFWLSGAGLLGGQRKGSCQDGGERAQARRSPGLSPEIIWDARPARLSQSSKTRAFQPDPGPGDGPCMATNWTRHPTAKDG